MAKSGTPKYRHEPRAALPRIATDPESYKKQTPVWRFSMFDWDGPWGISALAKKDLRKHFEKHLANLESMTWASIESATGGKSHGTNSHDLPIEKFTKVARQRLAAKGIESDTIFSLRLENTVRVYGVRSGACLRIVLFDPFHFEGSKEAAYEWS